jgi:hypothetical protein
MKKIVFQILLLIYLINSNKIYVDNNGIDNEACGLESKPCKTLFHSITKVKDHGEIILNDGTYSRQDNNLLKIISKTFTIKSKNGNPKNARINGEKMLFMFEIQNSHINFTDLTLENCHADFYGCFPIRNSEVFFKNTLITNFKSNYAHNESLIEAVDSKIHVENTVISNSLVGSSGIISVRYGVLDIKNSEFENCRINQYQGIGASHSIVTIDNFKVRNIKGNYGTLLSFTNSNVHIKNSEFSNNILESFDNIISGIFDKLIVEDSNFYENTAHSIIRVQSAEQKSYFKNLLLSKNTCKTDLLELNNGEFSLKNIERRNWIKKNLKK